MSRTLQNLTTEILKSIHHATVNLPTPNSKTKVMVFSKEENVQCNIKVNGEYLEQVLSLIHI